MMNKAKIPMSGKRYEVTVEESRCYKVFVFAENETKARNEAMGMNSQWLREWGQALPIDVSVVAIKET